MLILLINQSVYSLFLVYKVLQQTRPGQVYFTVRLPKPGFFKLQLYALPESDRSDSLPGVFNYLIQSQNCHRLRGQVMPFPQQFSNWRRGCYLDTPTDGILGLGSNGRLLSSAPDELTFNLSIPDAIVVAVVVDEEWTYLQQKEDRWKGNVLMKPHWGQQSKLAVCANYNQNDVNYSYLLEYALAN